MWTVYRYRQRKAGKCASGKRRGRMENSLTAKKINKQHTELPFRNYMLGMYYEIKFNGL